MASTTDKEHQPFQIDERLPGPQRLEGYPAVDMPNEALLQQTAICPECGMTAIKQRRAVETYHCLRCDKAFDTEEMIDVREGDLR